MKKIIKHYPMTDLLIVRGGYIIKNTRTSLYFAVIVQSMEEAARYLMCSVVLGERWMLLC